MRDEDRRHDEIQRGIHGLPHAGHDLAAHNVGRQMAGREPVAACFPGSALVNTPDGPRRIDEIKKGDEISCWNEDERSVMRRRVKKVRAHGPAAIMTVAFEGEQTPMRATGFHTVLTTRGWRRINQLKRGDGIIICDRHDLRTARIASLGAGTKRVPVYNLITEGEHNFIVDGVVAHNFTVLRRTRAYLHTCLEYLAALASARAKIVSTGMGEMRRQTQ